jgi:perosamine synthetase
MEMIPHSRPTLSDRDIEAVVNVLRSGMIAEGSLCAEFEREFAAYVGAARAVTVSTGTLAIQLALLALGVGHGDKVLMPTFMSRAPLDACFAIGGQPVPVDSDLDYNMNHELIAPLVKDVKAIIAPHILGITADIKAIREFGVPVIEDCAHSIGGTYNNQRLGTFGDITIVSFHATKVMTTGEGGIVSSCRADIVDKIRELKSNDKGKYHGRYLYPMTDMQAALGMSQLKQLDSFIEKRWQIADCYFSELKDLNCRLPFDLQNKSIFYRFPIQSDFPAEEIIKRYAAYGVHVRKPVCILLHQLLQRGASEYPIAEDLLKKTISLPIYPALKSEEMERIVEVTRKIFGILE